MSVASFGVQRNCARTPSACGAQNSSPVVRLFWNPFCWSECTAVSFEDKVSDSGMSTLAVIIARWYSLS